MSRDTQEDAILKVFGSVAVIVGVLLALPATTLWRAYVMTVLWTWFIVPQFGAEPLGMVSAIGLSLVGFVLFSHASKSQTANSEKSSAAKIGDFIGQAFLAPGLALLVGLIAKQWA